MAIALILGFFLLVTLGMLLTASGAAFGMTAILTFTVVFAIGGLSIARLVDDSTNTNYKK